MLGGVVARQASEDHARGEAGAAGVVVVEDAAHHLSRGVEAGYRLQAGVEDPTPVVDADAAEGEGNAAGNCVPQVRRSVDGLGPVGLVMREPGQCNVRP